MTLSPTTCRICLQTDSRTTNIFFTYSPPDGSSTAASAISRYAFVQVLQDDGLPQGICNVCQTELHRTLLFIKLCEKSDKQLRTNCPLQDKFLEVDEPPAPEQLVQIKEIPPILKVHPEPEGTNSEETVTIKEEYNQPDELQNDELQKEFYNDISQAVENQEQHLNFVDVKDIQEDVDMSSDEGMLDEQNFEDESGASVNMDLEEAMHYQKKRNKLSEQSQQLYKGLYMQFMRWRKRKGLTTFSEQVVLKYFEELPQKYKPPTLWSYYSMLRYRLLEHNVDVSKYKTVKALLKKKSVGYKSLKTKTFTSQEINQFIDEAPDSVYLCAKVALIFGVAIGFTKKQLSMLTVDNINDLGIGAKITLDGSNTATLWSKNYTIYKKYALLRPAFMTNRRFFINYRDNSCTNKPIGINKLGLMACAIAEYLNLPNPKLYTGHCFRRTSTLIYIDSNGNFNPKKGLAGTFINI